MNSPQAGSAGGIDRIAQLLLVAPIGLAAMLAGGSSWLAADASLSAAALGVVSVSLLGAAATAWLALDRCVGAPLREVADYLRAARRGNAAEPPCVGAGVIGDIAQLVDDIVQTQIQVGRHVIGREALEEVAGRLDDFTRAARAEQTTIARALARLADAPPGFGSDLRALPEQIGDRVETALARRASDRDLVEEFAAIRRALEAVQARAEAAGQARARLEERGRAGLEAEIERLRGIVEAKAAAAEKQGALALDRQRRLEAALTREFAALAERAEAARGAAGLEPAILRVEGAAAAMKEAVEGVSALDFARRAADLAAAAESLRQAGRASPGIDLPTIRRAFVEDIGALRGVLEGVFSRLGQLTSLAGVAAGERSAAARELEALQRAAASQTEALRALSDHVARRFEAVGEGEAQRRALLRLERIGAAVDALEARLADAPAAFQSLAALEATASAQVESDARQARMSDYLADRLEKALDLLATIEAAARENASAAATPRPPVPDPARTELARLGGAVESVAKDLAILRTGAGALAASLEDLRGLPNAIGDQARLTGALASDLARGLASLASPRGANDPPATVSDLQAGLAPLQQRLETLALHVGETAAAVASSRASAAARESDARRMMDALLVVQGLVQARPVADPGPRPRLSLDPDGIADRLDEVNARLDHIAERVEAFAEDHPAAAAPAPPDAEAATRAFAAAVERITLAGTEDLAARLCDLHRLLEGLEQKREPLADRLTTLEEASGKGFDRLTAQFGQLSGVVAAAPRVLAQEARAMLAPQGQELAELRRGLDEMRDALAGLHASVEGARGPFEPLVAPAARSLVVASGEEPDPSASMAAEMDALHGRLDDLAAGIDRLADIAERRREAPALPAVVSPAPFPDLAPAVASLQASSRALADGLAQWRALGPPVGRQGFEAAFEALRRDLRSAEASGSGSPDVLARLDGLAARLDRLAEALPEAAGAGLEPLVQRLAAFADRAGAIEDAVLRLAATGGEAALGARLDLFNQALAETLLGFEQKFERSRRAGAPTDLGPTDAQVAALEAMSRFMAAIEDRFSALESLAGTGGGGRGFETFDAKIAEMRQLTHEFLDISCAISAELAESAKGA